MCKEWLMVYSKWCELWSPVWGNRGGFIRKMQFVGSWYVLLTLAVHMYEWVTVFITCVYYLISSYNFPRSSWTQLQMRKTSGTETWRIFPEIIREWVAGPRFKPRLFAFWSLSPLDFLRPHLDVWSAEEKEGSYPQRGQNKSVPGEWENDSMLREWRGPLHVSNHPQAEYGVGKKIGTEFGEGKCGARSSLKYLPRNLKSNWKALKYLCCKWHPSNS